MFNANELEEGVNQSVDLGVGVQDMYNNIFLFQVFLISLFILLSNVDTCHHLI
jgi:hypothetical protein